MFVTFITIFFFFFFISSLVKFDHYRDTRASILDPCIQGIFIINCLHETNLFSTRILIQQFVLDMYYGRILLLFLEKYTKQNKTKINSLIGLKCEIPLMQGSNMNAGVSR